VPTYEYECGDCEHRFERKQRFNDEPVSACPECKGKARRVIHSAPVIFKGSGFYSTDSRKSDPGESKVPEKAKEALSKPKGDDK
jgi:putative FmdB family regulatory protein